MPSTLLSTQHVLNSLRDHQKDYHLTDTGTKKQRGSLPSVIQLLNAGHIANTGSLIQESSVGLEPGLPVLP